MKREQVWIVGVMLVLGVAFTEGNAWADKKIGVTYETYDNAGVVCVKDKPVIKPKDVTIKKLGQKIKWELSKTAGNDAGGTWEITKVEGGRNPSVDLCQGKIMFNAQGKAECDVAAELKYSYKLTWSKAGCAPVEADPTIFFEGGGGTGMFFPGILVSAVFAVIAFSLGLGFARWKRRSSS